MYRPSYGCDRYIYNTEKEARQVLKLTQRKNRTAKIKKVYHCQFCGYWHLTSQNKKYKGIQIV